ncbi:hypothetical protein ACFQ21_17150 [Ohtaekwangia kribbensis]|jgi:hypothetical protein|uniref:Uncharacterized protein n=1 Tax=Ohtaekwangia kribbensis TaxID=688913 RepID=A0ABW3K476_9BACT
METDYTVAYIITNVIAILTAVIAMLWPNVGRVFLSGIFIGAAAFNAFTASGNPGLYLQFGELTTSGFYRGIILGPFSEHIQAYIFIIAGCQVLIGAFLLYKGKLLKTAMVGAIIFLLAIAPLGIGSAFPSSLILATALVILLRKKIEYSIYEGLGRKIKYSSH